MPKPIKPLAISSKTIVKKIVKKRKVKIEDDNFELIAKDTLAKLQEEIEESTEDSIIKELPPVQMDATEDQELDDTGDRSLDEKIPVLEDIELSDIDNGGELILNGPPVASWADDANNRKFNQGDNVVPVNLASYKNFECWIVIGPGKDPQTYYVRKSKVQGEIIVKAHIIKAAPKNCLPYVSYWDHTDPFKSFGNLKISCPSNSKK